MNGEATAWTPSAASTAWAPAPGPGHETLIAIDVECVATSPSPRDRAVALVAAVDASGERVFFEYVKPQDEVVSPLTLLTGVTRRDLATARPLEEVVAKLREQLLGPHVVLVGHGIKSDISWLQLQSGVDFASTRDTAKLFALRLDSGTMTPSLRHLSLALLHTDMQSGAHSPDVDARFAMQLYLMHAQMGAEQLFGASQMILATPKPPPFAKMYPYIDGCALSHRSPQYDAQLDECRRVVFLDLDGVLNRTAKNDHLRLEPDLVGNLKMLLEASEAELRAESGESAKAGTAAAAVAAGRAASAGKRARVGIVISSFWRPFLEYVKYVLFRKGIDTSIVCGTTSLDGMHAVAHHEQSMARASNAGSSDSLQARMPARCELIQRYLDEHPWISRCCILDDRPGASNTNLAPHFVQTNALQGLTQEKVGEAVACLRIPIKEN